MFPAYLQGMESYHPGRGTRPGKGVPSLPTRDGKMDALEKSTYDPPRSQPTYKGWKPEVVS